MDFIKNFFSKHSRSAFKKELRNILGFKPGNISLYKTALTHRSIREAAAENNERLEYLGDAVLSALIADYLFKRYYLDHGYKKASKWVLESIILPHMFMDDLELLEINHKNKLYGWANKNGKVLEFETLNEKLENGRRLFTVAAVVDGRNVAEGKAFNKKDASQIAAQVAVEKLGILNADSVIEEFGDTKAES